MVSTALVLVGALMGLGVWTISTDSTEIVAVRSAVDRGEVVAADDLMVVRVTVDPAVQVIPAAQLDGLVGQRAASDLVAGSLLAPGGITDLVVPRTGESLVGIALAFGQLPAEPLRPGDKVRLVQTPADQADVPATQVTIDAVVQGISEVGSDGLTVVVDVVVPTSRAAEVAARAATGRVALVLESR
ncbi:MAG: SAF domain-containing protein, partial [Propionicimonas sp.]